MFFHRRRKKEVKEYMKYQDGKIISIEVEQKPRYQPPESYYVEDSDPKPVWKTVKEKTMSWFTTEHIKHIAYAIVFLFFLYCLYDVYKVFFLTDSANKTPSEQPIAEDQLLNQQYENPASRQDSITYQNNNIMDEGGKEPDNGYFSTEPITGYDGLDDAQTEKEIIKNLLLYTNQVNQEIIATSKDEITHVQDYLTKKANYIGLKSRLNRSFQRKKAVYEDFQLYQGICREYNMGVLYEETEKRIVESLTFTSQMITLLDTYSSANGFQALIDRYIQTDEVIRKNQADRLIDILEERNIPYTLDKERHQIQYSIQ